MRKFISCKFSRRHSSLHQAVGNGIEGENEGEDEREDEREDEEGMVEREGTERPKEVNQGCPRWIPR